MHMSFSTHLRPTSVFSKLTQDSVPKTDSLAPPLTYEEAKMAVAEAFQTAVGQLKEKYPPKSLQERAMETMEETKGNKKAESTEASETLSSADNQEGKDSGDTNKNLDVYA